MAAKYLKPALITVGVIALLAGGLYWHIYAVTHKPTSAKANTGSTPAALHSSEEAVQAADDLYKHYLPLKNEVVAEVGDNPLIEPALVQAVRGTKEYYDESLYTHFLEDYMKEYRDTGHVTRDEIACTSTTTNGSSATLVSTSGDTAVVNETLQLVTGTTRIVPVTIDLHTLKAIKINCAV